MKEDFQTVNRFESHGGGWGYSGHSIEAIRFMCDTEILLGKPPQSSVILVNNSVDLLYKILILDLRQKYVAKHLRCTGSRSRVAYAEPLPNICINNIMSNDFYYFIIVFNFV